ncbi:MAG: hypothetical protein H0V19_06400, partial [Euzebyales bacterium]|nr:hypothetical protein [Euzebyales bacterium]
MPAVTRAGRATVIATVVLALAGCGDADGVPDLPPGVDPSAVPSLAPTDGPLTGLPACQAPPRPGPAPPVDGLVLPDGA